MCLKPQPPRPMPPELAAWGAAHLPATSPYRLVGDTLYAHSHDEDFADLYHPEGKPALSPVLLALVTAFQHFENLSDRRTTMMVRTRLDWKYALHLPLDDAGFDASVLCEFRQRLLAHGADARVFDQVLGQLKALGLLTTRGSQRTDSLALLSRAHDLGRRELVFETMRVVLRALLAAYADWLRTTMPADWATRYARHCRDERHSADERAALVRAAGRSITLCPRNRIKSTRQRTWRHGLRSTRVQEWKPATYCAPGRAIRAPFTPTGFTSPADLSFPPKP